MYSRYNTRTQHDVFTSEYPAFSKKLCRSNCNLKHTDTAIISSSCNKEPVFGHREVCSHAAKCYAPPHITLYEGCTICPRSGIDNSLRD
jgi:hypothetical protein